MRDANPWAALAAQLERAAATGTDIGAVLHQVTADNALPDDHPARSLAYRVADVVPEWRLDQCALHEVSGDPLLLDVPPLDSQPAR